MIVALLIVIIIILLPGGIGFLARLWSAFIILLGLGIAYVLFGTTGYWVMGGVFLAVFAYFAWEWIAERWRSRNTPPFSAVPLSPAPPKPGHEPSSAVNWSQDRTASLVNRDEEDAIQREKIWRKASEKEAAKARDPFFRMADGRVVKRALPDLEELLSQPGMIETFKTNSKLVYPRPADGPEIWRHPVGIYMAVPNIGEERLFSSIAAARDYHDRCRRRD